MTNQQRLFEEKMTREELAQYLWKAADVYGKIPGKLELTLGRSSMKPWIG